MVQEVVAVSGVISRLLYIALREGSLIFPIRHLHSEQSMDAEAVSTQNTFCIVDEGEAHSNITVMSN